MGLLSLVIKREPLLNNSFISFTFEPDVDNEVLDKVSTKGLKKWIENTSLLGSAYNTEISYFYKFKVKKLIYKNNKFYVEGNIKLMNNNIPDKLNTKYHYREFIKISIPKSSNAGEPIQYINKQGVFYHNVNDIIINDPTEKVNISKKKSKRKTNTNIKKRTMKKRKGPSESATIFSVGTKKKGNDDNMWIIIKTKNGIKRWKKL